MRPPDSSSMSIAALAASIGERMNAYAMPVPSITRCVAVATAASRTKPAALKNSIVHTDSKPALLGANGCVDLSLDIGAREDQAVFHGRSPACEAVIAAE